jgi:hypothetical protein
MKLRSAAIGSKKVGRVKHLRFWNEDPIAEFKRRQSRQTRSKIARALRGKRKRLGKKFADLHGFRKGDLELYFPRLARKERERRLEKENRFAHKAGLAGAGLGAVIGAPLGAGASTIDAGSQHKDSPLGSAIVGSVLGGGVGYVAGNIAGSIVHEIGSDIKGLSSKRRR